ncbi:unnamed protein product, partial [Dibothriocephalus latus]
MPNRLFFESGYKEGHLKVRIKCDDKVLAVSNVSLIDLLQQVDHAFLQPVSSEETIWLHPVNVQKQSIKNDPGDGSDAAFVVLRIGLQRDSAKAVASRPLTSCDETVTFSGKPQHPDDKDVLLASNVPILSMLLQIRLETKTNRFFNCFHGSFAAPTLQVGQTIGFTEQLSFLGLTKMSLRLKLPSTTGEVELFPTNKDVVDLAGGLSSAYPDPTGDVLFDLDLAVANLTANCEPPLMEPIQPATVTLQSASRSPTPAASEPLHRFCYSIELKTLQAINPLPENSLVYARYVYPLFGSRSPIMTLPPVALTGTDETVLPQGFCAFELAAEPAELRQRLAEEPLVIEVLDRSKANNTAEVLLGQTSFSLEQVFSEQPRQLAHCLRIRTDGVAGVKSTNNGLVIARLAYSLTLEDFGPHNSSDESDEGQQQLQQQKNDVKEAEDIAPSLRQRRSSADGSAVSCLRPSRSAADLPTAFPSVEVRQTAEYRAALELELWRAEEEARFKASL